MKTVGLWVLVAVAVGGIVGTLIVHDPGYVLLAYGGASFESSLWFFLGVLGGIYLLVRGSAALVRRFLAGGSQLRSWSRNRAETQARRQTVAGLLKLAEGDWRGGKKQLLAAAPKAETPLINYLSAARAANASGDLSERDELLRQAHATTPGSRFAVGLTQAQLMLDKSQWEAALAVLLELRRLRDKQPEVLEMLARCYRALADHQALLELVPDLRQQKVYDEDRLAQLEREGWLARFAAAARDDAATRVPAAWAEVPKELKRDPAVLCGYALQAAGSGLGPAAEQELRSALERQWHDDLVAAYGRVEGEDPAKQLVSAERWVKERPNNAVLLLALGRLSMRNHDWAKAREYFEASLRLKRDGEVYGELGRLLTALGDSTRATEYVNLALSMPAGALPGLPLPQRGA